ncbi:MAG TPA: acetoin utilization protein AcuC [Chloroflexota bacterium]|nr:acetoin utilization protein AcuC [Chloroflexota bacterium]
MNPVAFLYHPLYGERGFSRVRASWPRYALGRHLLSDLKLLPPANYAVIGESIADYPLVEFRPEPSRDDELLAVHPPALLAHIREADARGTGFLDYGDTPAWRGVWRRTTLAVGGTLLAVRLVAQGEFKRAFNPAGGLHHAQRERAAGFCPLNDVVIAVRALQSEFGYRRIAIIDLDGHHGDGTEALLYDENVLTISIHRYGGTFYPRTGAAGDRGRGAGYGYNLNVPLDRGTSGERYLHAFQSLVKPLLHQYLPRIIIVVLGADSHWADPLVRLGLGLPDFARLSGELAQLADEYCEGKLVVVAGGGYAPEHVARCWATYLGVLSDAWLPDDPRLKALFDADRIARQASGV